MNKLKVFFARIKSGSFGRMFMYIDQIKKESGQNKIITFFDMLWCIFRYNVGYLEYRVFGFCYIKGSKSRSSFLTMNDNLLLVNTLNNKEYQHYFKDKIEFNNQFKEYIGRDFLDIRNISIEDFKSFLNTHPIVFAKVLDEFGGLGIKRIESKKVIDYNKTYNDLINNKQYLLEEGLVQHETMNKLNPTSVNTVRIVTVTKDNQPHVMYSLVRMGSGSGYVDNISSGGLYAPVNSKGVINKPAFCDKTGEIYNIHPSTKTKLVNFEIPYYKEAINLCKKAALKFPEMGYVGWDIVIKNNGPAIVEGNEMPGYDMCQNYYHLEDKETGIKLKFESVLGKEFFK